MPDEQQQLIAALRASEAKFSGILEIAADAIITIDDQQRVLHFNRGAEEVFGWQATDAVGQRLEVFLPARFRALHEGHVRTFGHATEHARRMGHRREVSGLRADGSEFPAEASISKLDLADGVRIYTVVLRDITERKRAEEAERFLAEAGARVAESLETARVERAIVDTAIPRLAEACILDTVDGPGPIHRVAKGSTERMDRVVQLLAERFPLGWESASPYLVIWRRPVP